ncbi:MAG: DUF4402 domain-containing protein [Proteobacteria bacterium]|nr:DUF4402 domain-containing protein [Pseudomonadota bacterium]
MCNVRYLLLFLPVLLLVTYTESAFPVTANTEQGLSFGTIIANPSGDEIEIDARYGPATPVLISDGYSHIGDNGYSGIIRVRSDAPGQTITLLYPDSVTLEAAGGVDTMPLYFINARSELTATSTLADEDFYFDIGGRLHIKSGQLGLSYIGIMTVTINVTNP